MGYGTGSKKAKVWAEHRPEVVRRTDVGLENIIMTSRSHTIDPPVALYHSVRSNGDRTVVMEVKGVDHLDIAKHSYVHYLIFEDLLDKMVLDLCLDTTCQAHEQERKKQSEFPLDFTFLGREISSATMSMLEYLRKSIPGLPV